MKLRRMNVEYRGNFLMARPILLWNSLPREMVEDACDGLAHRNPLRLPTDVPRLLLPLLSLPAWDSSTLSC